MGDTNRIGPEGSSLLREGVKELIGQTNHHMIWPGFHVLSGPPLRYDLGG